MWKLALVVLLVILQCSCAAPAPACMGTLCGPTVNADEARIVLAAPGSLGTLSGPRAVVADAPLAPSSGTVVTAVTTVSAPIAGPVAACCATATTIDVCCSVNPCCEACPTRVTCVSISVRVCHSFHAFLISNRSLRSRRKFLLLQTRIHGALSVFSCAGGC